VADEHDAVEGDMSRAEMEAIVKVDLAQVAFVPFMVGFVC